MELTLTIDGKKKKFKQPAFMPAIRFKESIKLSFLLDTSFSPEIMDEAVDFIATKLYAGKFTPEEFWNGIDAGDVMEIIAGALQSPARRAQEKLEALKN